MWSWWASCSGTGISQPTRPTRLHLVDSAAGASPWAARVSAPIPAPCSLHPCSLHPCSLYQGSLHPCSPPLPSQLPPSLLTSSLLTASLRAAALLRLLCYQAARLMGCSRHFRPCTRFAAPTRRATQRVVGSCRPNRCVRCCTHGIPSQCRFEQPRPNFCSTAPCPRHAAPRLLV